MHLRVLPLALLAACAPADPVVAGARLAGADGTVPAAPGVVITPRAEAPLGPAGAAVRIAADRDAATAEVLAAAARVERAGGRAVLLVARRQRVEALPPFDPPAPPALRLVATREGKACVSAPGVDEAICVARPSDARIDRAFTREAVRKAVAETGLTHVDLELDGRLTWADAVRAIDGARTCCPGKQIAVTLLQ